MDGWVVERMGSLQCPGKVTKNHKRRKNQICGVCAMNVGWMSFYGRFSPGNFQNALLMGFKYIAVVPKLKPL